MLFSKHNEVFVPPMSLPKAAMDGGGLETPFFNMIKRMSRVTGHHTTFVSQSAAILQENLFLEPALCFEFFVFLDDFIHAVLAMQNVGQSTCTDSDYRFLINTLGLAHPHSRTIPVFEYFLAKIYFSLDAEYKHQFLQKKGLPQGNYSVIVDNNRHFNCVRCLLYLHRESILNHENIDVFLTALASVSSGEAYSLIEKCFKTLQGAGALTENSALRVIIHRDIKNLDAALCMLETSHCLSKEYCDALIQKQTPMNLAAALIDLSIFPSLDTPNNRALLLQHIDLKMLVESFEVLKQHHAFTADIVSMLFQQEKDLEYLVQILLILKNLKLLSLENYNKVIEQHDFIELATGLFSLRASGLLNQTSCLILLDHAEPDSIAIIFSALQKSKILSSKNHLAVMNYSRPIPILAKAIDLLSKKNILSEHYFYAVLFHQNPSELAHALMSFEKSHLMTDEVFNMVNQLPDPFWFTKAYRWLHQNNAWDVPGEVLKTVEAFQQYLIALPSSKGRKDWKDKAQTLYRYTLECIAELYPTPDYSALPTQALDALSLEEKVLQKALTLWKMSDKINPHDLLSRPLPTSFQGVEVFLEKKGHAARKRQNPWHSFFSQKMDTSSTKNEECPENQNVIGN